ncbi:MAG: Serpin family protein [Ignavibacteria bacterium]|nr:Serpin family protein [Ignavibacteria bacterium]
MVMTMKKITFLIFSICLLFMASCQKDNNPIKPEPTRELTQSELQLLTTNNRFAFKLFREVSNEEPGKNLFISPFSVSVALGMANNGAASTTRDAFIRVLEQQGMNIEEINKSYQGLQDVLPILDPNVRFDIANSCWYKLGYSFEQSFFDICAQYFYSSVTGLDFGNPESVKIINKWVSDKTAGKIPEVIDQINANSVLFLINALYFKASWTVEFDKKKTFTGGFKKVDNSTVSCSMMFRDDSLMSLETSEFDAVELPYGNGAYSMILFLPKQNVSMNQFIQSMNETNWSSWLSGFKLNRVQLMMPKFKFEYDISLKPALMAMGLGIAFDGGADFSNLCKSGLFIGDVIHKTFVDVAEQGTEAAAVTVIDFRDSLPDKLYIYLNRPFVFVMKERISNTIEFMGRVMEPKY